MISPSDLKVVAVDQTGQVFIAQFIEEYANSPQVTLLIRIDPLAEIKNASVASLLLIYSDHLTPIENLLAELDIKHNSLTKETSSY